MQDLNDLFYFAKVVEAGGFAAAGRQLGIPKSRLSRRIAELEERLGARLLQRTTRKLAVTEVGDRYYRHCQAMLLEAEQADEAVASLISEPRGRVRVSCPIAVAGFSEVVVDFLTTYPLVTLETIVTNRRVDLVNEGIDVALRVRTADDEDPSLIVRRLQPAIAYLVCSPGLLDEQLISHPEDLAKLAVLGAPDADRKVRYRLVNGDGEIREVALEPRLVVDDFGIRKASALAGLGLTMLPRGYCEDELASGELIRVLPDWTLPGGHLQIAYLHRRGMLPAVRAWIDHLAKVFGQD
ncbi:LysR substrate-binding domain-containing protein [Pseudomonas sp. SST3]|uniref:LysR substrate-binding domain-containing protein n=1 Tax=Pseudomonas sp. SST3 TaxID=2267882 RepID=UPI000E052599|nr:LysR substrate-binding domain-containing protein [Pseudomonas sp. SST3]NKQ10519.1 LysR family transcriptional regulator [Pseudomonas sp. SST3]